jgi:hypothetical protein
MRVRVQHPATAVVLAVVLAALTGCTAPTEPPTPSPTAIADPLADEAVLPETPEQFGKKAAAAESTRVLDAIQA